MSDLPVLAGPTQRFTLSTYSLNSLGGDVTALTGPGGSGAWLAANRAIYVPFWIDVTLVVKSMLVIVGTQSGNLDLGIYDISGGRIVSKGSTAVAVAGNQIVNMTTAVTGTASPVLTPGTYFAAMNVDNVTAAFNRVAPTSQALQNAGVQQQAVGAVTLPATAAFANPASGYLPYIAISGMVLP